MFAERPDGSFWSSTWRVQNDANARRLTLSAGELDRGTIPWLVISAGSEFQTVPLLDRPIAGGIQSDQGLAFDCCALEMPGCSPVYCTLKSECGYLVLYYDDVPGQVFCQAAIGDVRLVIPTH